MVNIEYEKEMLFVKLIRKGPHILEFSEDYMMVHNGRITLATAAVLEKYFSINETDNIESRRKKVQTVAELIDKEFYGNSNLEWYSLREYIDNFNVNRLEELKHNINKAS